MNTLNRTTLRASWHSWLSNDFNPRGPAWLQWVWTLLFVVGMAFIFTLLGMVLGRGWSAPVSKWLEWFTKNFVVCFVIGLVIHALYWLSRQIIRDLQVLDQGSRWKRTLFHSGVPALGVVIGWPIGAALVGVDLAGWLARPSGRATMAWTILIAVAVTLLMHHFFIARGRQLEAERRASEAQLRALQAQMEPHFLFNTLANVHSLIAIDPTRAQTMLGTFTDYLRATLSLVREPQSTLAQELTMARAYLDLMHMRLGERLRFVVDVDPAAMTLVLPTMVLQPLVENAIAHGLEPKLDGGTVTIHGARQGDDLVLTVEDDGVGLAANSAPSASDRHQGLALSNLRQRLLETYGQQASLAVVNHPTKPSGARATLRLPWTPMTHS